MILCGLNLDVTANCIPRESGDDPDGTHTYSIEAQYSPRERG